VAESDEAIGDEAFGDEAFGDESIADKSTTLADGEALGETAVFSKTFVCRVERREGRVAIMDNNIRCDLNTTPATFTPLAGQFIASAFYSVATLRDVVKFKRG